MAPRRNHNNNSSIVQHHQLQQQHHHHQQQQQQGLLATPQYYNEPEQQQEQEITQQQHQQQAENLIESISAQFGNNSNNTTTMSPMQTTLSNSNNNANVNTSTTGIITISQIGNHSNTDQQQQQQQQQQYTRCCYPNGDCMQLDQLIALNDLSDCVRVLCNNENCNIGQYMHRECFEHWEQSVLNTLKTMGRARSWSERQRTQNLWTKKGYDLVYKACGCKCGRGHLRKDLEWTAPSVTSSASKTNGTLHYVNGGNCGGNVLLNGNSVNGQRVGLSNGNVICNGNSANNNNTNNNNNNNNNNNVDDDEKKKKKKRNRNNQLKTATTPATNGTLPLTPLQQQNGFATNGNQQPTPQQQQAQNMQNNQQQQQQQQQNVQNNNHNNQNNNNNCNNNTTNNMSNNNSNGLDLMPNPNVGVIGSGLHANSSSNNNTNQNSNNTNQQQQQQQQQQNLLSINNLLNGHATNALLGLDLRARAGSLSSSGAGSGSTSPAASQSSIDISISPIHHLHHHHQQQQQQHQLQLLQQFDQQQQQQALQQQQQQLQLNGLTKRLLNGGITNNNNNATTNLLVKQPQAMLATSNATSQLQQQQQQQQQLISNGFKQFNAFDQQQLILQQKVKEVEIYSERVRSTSGCNGIFSRRLDFSSFNLLPKTRLNSYQVKIEDEGNHGNDETRLFILSSLAQSQRSRVACILCEENMLVFDRYPLVDGSFFLSPKQHSTGCIEVKYEGRTLFLTSVCMSCLDGTSSNRMISCRFCAEIWDGSNLVLGTMYAYDIFAAMPCCAERLKCNNCFKLLLHPQQRLSFYSDYSHCVTCPFCATQDTHFVKPLTYCYTKSNVGRMPHIA